LYNVSVLHLDFQQPCSAYSEVSFLQEILISIFPVFFGWPGINLKSTWANKDMINVLGKGKSETSCANHYMIPYLYVNDQNVDMDQKEPQQPRNTQRPFSIKEDENSMENIWRIDCVK